MLFHPLLKIFLWYYDAVPDPQRREVFFVHQLVPTGRRYAYTLCDLPCPDEPENAPAATYKIPDLTPGALPVTLPMSGSYFIDSFETKTNALGGVGHLVMRQDIDYI